MGRSFIAIRSNQRLESYDTDLAQMWYYYAYIHFSQDNLRLAKYDYQQFLAIPDTDPDLRQV